jgi:hypothetical protein
MKGHFNRVQDKEVLKSLLFWEIPNGFRRTSTCQSGVGPETIAT